MKFKVREGFVVRIVSTVDLGDGRKQAQENHFYAGQAVDLDAAQADDHTHKLEPVDKAAAAFLDAKVLPVSAPTAAMPTPDVMAMAKAMASEIVAQVLAAQQGAAAGSKAPAGAA